MRTTFACHDAPPFLLPFLFLSLFTLSATASNAVGITSPGVCLDDLDCPITSFCRPDSAIRPVRRCVPRLGLNAVCPIIGTTVCRPGLVCLRLNFGTTFTCRPQGRVGDECSSSIRNQCISPLVCSRGKCATKDEDKAGDKCYSHSECQQFGDFYCTNAPGICARKKPAGEPCGPTNENFECIGLCAINNNKFNMGTCKDRIPIGGKCWQDRQCAPTTTLVNGRRDRVVCNGGRCIRYTNILNVLGAPCHRNFDRCQRLRGLRCLWAPTAKRSVCQHAPDPAVGSTSTYCSPGSPYSRCANDVPGGLVCRGAIPILGGPLETFTFCSKPTYTAAVGKKCRDGLARCIAGSQCLVVPGVRFPFVNDRQYGPPRQAYYCVRVQGQGGSCLNKFMAQCREGLICQAGKCVREKGEVQKKLPHQVENTHADRDVPCDTLLCVPELVCRWEPRTKSRRCQPPLPRAGWGRPCGEGSQKCVSGAVCKSDWNGNGRQLCRPKWGEGGYCEGDSWCKPGLRCPEAVIPGREKEGSRCYDPKKSIGLGGTCKPGASWNENRCVQTCIENRTTGESFKRPTTCVLAADKSKFLCVLVKL